MKKKKIDEKGKKEEKQQVTTTQQMCENKENHKSQAILERFEKKLKNVF